jgi:hypothetical protein
MYKNNFHERNGRTLTILGFAIAKKRKFVSIKKTFSNFQTFGRKSNTCVYKSLLLLFFLDSPLGQNVAYIITHIIIFVVTWVTYY